MKTGKWTLACFDLQPTQHKTNCLNSVILSSHMIDILKTKANQATFKNTIILFTCPPKFCISIVFILSWDLQWSQERLETMLMQTFGGTNKEYNGIFESGLLFEKSPFQKGNFPFFYKGNTLLRGEISRFGDFQCQCRVTQCNIFNSTSLLIAFVR